MGILFILLLLAPFVGAFQVFYAMALFTTHHNRENLAPYLVRYFAGVAFYFLSMPILNHFDLGYRNQEIAFVLYILAAIALFCYNLWIMVNRNKIGTSKESAVDDHAQDPFVGDESPEVL